MKNILHLVTLLSFCLTPLLSSCGKKSALEYPYEKKRPKFGGVSDEIDRPMASPSSKSSSN